MLLTIFPLMLIVLALSFYLYKQTLMAYIGPQHFQIILTFAVTLFIFGLLGILLSFLDNIVFYIIWLIIALGFIAMIGLVFKKLNDEYKNKTD